MPDPIKLILRAQLHDLIGDEKVVNARCDFLRWRWPSCTNLIDEEKHRRHAAALRMEAVDGQKRCPKSLVQEEVEE